jgi:hypothetical protein
MVSLPEDVCNYIISFLPVKDPQYDHCIHQLMYLFGEHKAWRRQLNIYGFTHPNIEINKFISMRKFILGKNRTKYEIDKPIQYNLFEMKKMKEHRQKLRRQLLHQQMHAERITKN